MFTSELCIVVAGRLSSMEVSSCPAQSCVECGLVWFDHSKENMVYSGAATKMTQEHFKKR